MSRELRYGLNDTLMQAEPKNTSIAILVRLLTHRLNEPDRAHYVELEPGDGTRYELVIIPLAIIQMGASSRRGLPGWNREDLNFLVVRCRGGMPFATTILNKHEYSEAAGLLAGKNTWTAEFLDWWFERLFEEIKAL